MASSTLLFYKVVVLALKLTYKHGVQGAFSGRKKGVRNYLS